jgi:PBSX family phage terminase large subunit
MILHPAQSLIAKDLHRFRVVNCGRRFGKTSLAVLEMVAKAVYGDNRQICYIAPTYQQARDIAWQELKRIALPAIAKVNESRLEITLNTTKGGTSTIMLRGWESIETLRGQKFHFIVVDEIASMRNWDVNWEEVIRPTLTDVRGEALFISTPKGFNHFYRLFNKQDTDTDYKSFHFTSYDNPHLPVDELDKAKEELTEDRFAQEYLADFRKTEGLVYKEFSRDRHLFNGPVTAKISEYIGGVDFGYTNPCAVVHIYKDYDNTYWVSHEWYRTSRTEAQIADYVQSCKFNAVYPDPENASAIRVLTDKGIEVREVDKSPGSVATGINKIRSLFKRNKIWINNNCVNLISELETYAYPEKKPDHNESEKPIKEHDHALDALRYAIMGNIPEDEVELDRIRHERALTKFRNVKNTAR